ncbi:MAG: hypothetical protein ABW168_11310 [Sedimenticola sp.]
MKKFFIITALALLTSACVTVKPKPCDCDGISELSGECGKEIEINTTKTL